MRVQAAIRSLMQAAVQLVLPAKMQISRSIIGQVRRLLENETIIMPDGSKWLNCNVIKIFLSSKDLYELGGLSDALEHQLEMYANHYVIDRRMRSRYGKLMLDLLCHVELAPGEVHAEAFEDRALPVIPNYQDDLLGGNIHTICIRDSSCLKTQV